jgi:nucleotide-binding universal stress UspA family protein
MGTFSVEFKVGSLELDAMVTAFDHHRRFKVEMVTNEHNPIILQRSAKGDWSIEQPGQRSISEQGFKELEKAIDKHLYKIYSVKSILVLIDFSDAAANAARYVSAVASRFKTSEIILYHSLAIPLATDIPLQTPPVAVNFYQESINKLNQLKDEMQALVSDYTSITVRSDERTLVSAVNILAEQYHSGLVVMGITGKSTLEKTFIGSNTITIAKECKVPLLIVPAEAVFDDIKRVVFACDLKKVSETTPTQAIKTLIHILNAKLFILNVTHEEDHFNPDTIAELAALHRLWDDEQPEYHYTDHEDLVTGIMDFAKERQIQLVVTVPKEYGFFEGLFHRSLTKKLAYHTHLPLLLFKEDK